MSCCLLPAALLSLLAMRKTPPSGALPIPETLIHRRSTTTDWFDGGKFLTRNVAFPLLSKEMAPYFVGPMPPKDFLNYFLPKDLSNPSSSIFQPKMFTRLMEVASEADMYTAFVCSGAYYAHSQD